MSMDRWAPLRRLAALVLLLPALLSTCGKNSPTGGGGPELPIPDYLIEQGNAGEGSAIGWAQMTALPNRETSAWEARYYVPGHPFESRVEIRHERTQNGFVHDWKLGREEGPWLRTRTTKDEQGGWSWVLSGGGEFDLRHGLAGEGKAPGEGEEPVMVDPLSPLSFALLGWRWEAAGSPEDLDLPVLLFGLRRSAPEARDGHLVYEGEATQSGFELRAFRLELEDGTLYFKLMRDYFPALMSSWWDRDELALRYWGELLDLSDLAFDPEFPPPGDYAVQELSVPAGDLSLAVEVFRPTGDGPFPAALLLSDGAPADRNDAALLGHLAHDLAEGGWLVYRYDKPGTGASTGSLDALDLDGCRRALDAVWAALREDLSADPGRCVLMGHGEGGALALEKAGIDPTVAGVVALASPFYDPAVLAVIPEAIEAPGDFLSVLGLDCFVDKYRDLLAFSTAAYLTGPGWTDKPVLLYGGDMDETVSWEDLDQQAAALEAAGAHLRFKHWPGLDHFLNASRPDNPPAPALVDSLLNWLSELPPRIP